jgi:hypothetical protein
MLRSHPERQERHLYTKRLVFDISPYPPESEWKDRWSEVWLMPEGENYWDEKEFVNDSPSLEKFLAAHKSL